MKKFAVLFGGVSFEHEISIVSAIAMKKVFTETFEFIFLDNEHQFYLIDYKTIRSKTFSSGEYKKSPKLHLTQDGFIQKTLFGTKKLECEVVLNLIHGADGEDGTMASLLEFNGVEFIGPRVQACCVSFNKHMTKSYSQGCDVPTVKFDYFNLEDNNIKPRIYPAIIKPVTLGSSIGVSIVQNESELQYALDVAFEFDDEIIIEPFIDGVKEYNLAGAKVDGEFVFSMIEEPVKEKFLDFDKKYLDFNRTESIAKAELTQELQDKLQTAFKKLYNKTFEGSIIRCDFFLIDDEVHLNEINPIPGSMANYLFEDFTKLFYSLCDSLPQKKNIPITYEYVNKIHSAKGKL